MGKKKKGRCVKRNVQQQNVEPEELLKAPHTFVIHRGLPGDHIVELTKDFRKIMEPFTASSLKERKKNTIKDFISVAGVFHVTHLCIFSRTELGMYLKLARVPRGPTLTFKIHNFSLARDVISSLSKQFVYEKAFEHSPLIVLNNFTGEGLQMKLMATMFQNMFPTINLTTVNLNSIRRCVLVNYNTSTKLIDFRHYIIKVIPVGISKGVKKVVQGKIPNLSKCNDISEFFTKTAVMSESEAEDDPSSHVTLAQELKSRGNLQSSKSAIKLSEIGPRLTLQLIKVEDGLLDGEVLFHELIHKTDEEVEAVRKMREKKRKLKEKRKKIQEENKKKKESEKEKLIEKSLEGMKKKNKEKNTKNKKLENDILMQKAQLESNQHCMREDDDDAEYYREELGQEPDQDLFTKSIKKREFNSTYKKKKMSETMDKNNKKIVKSFNRTKQKNKIDGKPEKRMKNGKTGINKKLHKVKRGRIHKNKKK